MRENNSTSDFSITIDYEKGVGSPSRVFRAMSDLIDALQETDKSLVAGIDGKITPILLLEDIQTSSVKSWFKQALSPLGSEIIRKDSEARSIEKYLVDAKYYIINFLEGKVDITDGNEVERLIRDLNGLAELTNVNQIPAYEPIPRENLLYGIEKINNALTPLNDTDKAKFSTSSGKEASFNLSLRIAPEAISDLITAETLDSKAVMILKVKKPDFLGNSQWEFKHDNRTITARILDDRWLEGFRNGDFIIQPNDAIRAEVIMEVHYGFDRDVVSTTYKIVNVIEVIRPNFPKQNNLFEA